MRACIRRVVAVGRGGGHFCQGGGGGGGGVNAA